MKINSEGAAVPEGGVEALLRAPYLATQIIYPY